MAVRSKTRQAKSSLFLKSDGTDIHAADALEPGGKFLGVTDRFHREIHEGEAFSVCRLFTDVGDDANADILIQTGATKELHLTASISTEGKGYFYLYEGSEFSVAGTAITAINRLRASSETSEATFTFGPTMDSVLGSDIACGLSPGSAGGIRVGGTATSGREEHVLKINTVYLIRVTNKAGQAKDISIALSWYEEEPGT